MEYHLWDVVVPVSLTLLLLVLVFTIAVCKYKRCMNMGKDVALRRHRKLWMTCGSLGSEFPSRSTTEQSLYFQSTEDQNRPPTLLADASVQTSQFIYPQDVYPDIASPESATFIHNTDNSSNIMQQQHTPITLSFNTIIPSCYPEKCPITDDSIQTTVQTVKVLPLNTANDNLLHLKDTPTNLENRSLNGCHWKATFGDKCCDEDITLLSNSKQLTDSPCLDKEPFNSHKSTELLLLHD